MLPQTIFLSALFFVAKTNAYTFDDLSENLILNQIRQANASVLPLIERTLNTSTIWEKIGLKLFEEIANRSDVIFSSVVQTKQLITSFKSLHPRINVRECKKLADVQAANMVLSFDKTLMCSVTKIETYYHKKLYNDITKDFESCQKIDSQDSRLTFACYRDARKKIISSVENLEKMDSSVFNTFDSDTKQILNDCKEANKLIELFDRMSRITDLVDQCIIDILSKN